MDGRGPAMDGGGKGYGACKDVGEDTDSRRLRCQACGSCDRFGGIRGQSVGGR